MIDRSGSYESHDAEEQTVAQAVLWRTASDCRYQAVTLKFRLLSIYSTSERFSVDGNGR